MKQRNMSTGLLALFSAMWVVAVSAAYAQDKPPANVKGRVSLDFPNAPEPTIAVNLSGQLLALLSRSAKQEPGVSQFAAMIEGIYVRGYDKASGDSDRMARHFEDVLKKEKWELIVKIKEEDDLIKVYLLPDQDIVHGIFVMLANPTETILVNVFGKIDVDKIGGLLEHLPADLDLPELKELKNKALKQQIEDK
jgi:hypothetical protein